MRLAITIILLSVVSFCSYAQGDLLGRKIKATVHIETPTLYTDSAEVGDLKASDSVVFTGLSTSSTASNVLSISDNGGISQLPTSSIIQKFQAEVENDLDNDFTIPFLLSETATIYYNSNVLHTSQWEGAGTSTLTVGFVTKKYDKIYILN